MESKKEKTEQMVRKYKTYVRNLHWNLANNDFSPERKAEIRTQIDCYNEIIGDLQCLIPKPKLVK